MPQPFWSPIHINDRGQIMAEVKYHDADDNLRSVIYRWERGRQVQMSPTPGPHETTWFADMNERGDMAGTTLVDDGTSSQVTGRPWLWSRGRRVDMSSAGSAVFAALDDHGRVALDNVANDPTRVHGFVWDRAGSSRRLLRRRARGSPSRPERQGPRRGDPPPVLRGRGRGVARRWRADVARPARRRLHRGRRHHRLGARGGFGRVGAVVQHRPRVGVASGRHVRATPS